MGSPAFSSEQQNTSNKNLPILSDETVTVVDPREPLYGQTFPLVFIENKPYRGSCCIVRDVNGVERHIPVAVTNRSAEPLAIFPIPLSLSSVRQLLSAYERIVRLTAKGTKDGSPASNPSDTPSRPPSSNSPHLASGSLDVPFDPTATENLPKPGDALSADPPIPRGGAA